MYFLSWILVAAAAGWLAGKIFRGNGYGPTMDMGMGIGGAIAAGLLMRSASFGRVQGSNYKTTVVAVVGAGIFAVNADLFNGRRMYARQL